jgi:glutaredoxin-dependent peroxiredoxin
MSTTLAVGAKAPEFTLPCKTPEGLTKISLNDSFGKSHVVILFVPMAYTPVCTKELCSASSDLDHYAKLDATVYSITGDNPFAQEAWAKEAGITIPLLCDYDHKVTEAFGVAYDNFLPDSGCRIAGVPKRSAFVIDKEGIIRYAEAHDDPTILPDFDKIKACLAEMK